MGISGYSQTYGNDCLNAISLDSLSITGISRDTLSGNEKWFRFTAFNTEHTIDIRNSDDLNSGHIHSVILFSGSCEHPIQIGDDIVSADSDTLLRISATNLVVGDFYLIQLMREFPVCTTRCSFPNAVYDILFKEC